MRFALDNKWQQAHQIAQDIDGPMAAWVHAVLHKIEGDESNSRYWYARAQKRFEDFTDPSAELRCIEKQLQA